MTGGSANKVVVDVELRAQLNQMKSGVKELENMFKNINLTPAKNAAFTQDFTTYKNNIKEIEELLSQPIGEKGLATVAKKLEQNDGLMNKFKKTLVSLGNYSDSQLEKIFPKSFTTMVQQAVNVLGTYEQKLKDIKAQDQEYGKASAQLEQQQTVWKNLTQEVEKYKQAQDNIDQGKILKPNEIKQFTAETQNAIQAWQKQQTAINNTEKNLQVLKSTYRATAEEYQKLNNGASYQNTDKGKAELAQIREMEVALRGAKVVAEDLKNTASQEVQFEILVKEEALQNAQAELDKIQGTIDNMDASQAQQAFEQVKSELQQIKGLNIDWNKISNLDQFRAELNNLSAEQLSQVKSALQQGSQVIKSVGDSSQEAKGKIDQAANSLQQMAQQMNSFTQLAQRGMYFLGMANQVQLFKRAVKEAFSAVKELDKAMTETAVVTNFSVGDMWEQLPEYSNVAREYNATLKDAYEVMTLYYQQGLETNQVFDVGTETMKMARIAGLDYSVATDRMTNALRGFNMEINNMNAEHIADVYSQLAAMSASNVKELSVAMTKVASLANSANMSFDNTAAFLAQIIETTRESAETAGTALKTVVARFSEVKKLYSEGDLIGDVDGEEVNINKVGAALRAAGVDLNEFATGAKGLDEIFIELASKWDSLDLLTQRYIATMAAGSRQQSRFLALMSDNARLTELLNGAYNATGASSEQFAKTQESLESKLNNLSVAWQQFLMGITNSDVIKGGVDLLTKLVEKLNLLTTTGDGITTAFSKVGLIINSFTLLRAGLTSIVRQITAEFKPQMQQVASEGAEGFKQGLQAGLSSIKTSMQHLFNKDLFGITTFLNNLRGQLDFSKFIDTQKLESAFSKVGVVGDHFQDLLNNIFIKGEQTSKVGALKITEQLSSGLLSGLNKIGINIKNTGIEQAFNSITTQVGNGDIKLGQAIDSIKNRLQMLKEQLEKDGNLGAAFKVESLIEGVNNFGIVIDSLGDKTQQLQQRMEIARDSMQKWQMGLSGLSMLMNSIGGIIEKTSKKANLLSNSFKSLGSALTSGASVLMAVSMFTSAIQNAEGALLNFGNILTSITPYLAAAAAIITLVISVIQMLNKASKEAAEAARASAQAAKEEADANKELLKSYEDLQEQIEQGTITKEELEDQTRKLIAAYDLEQQGLNALTSTYEDVAKAAKKAQQARDLAAGVSLKEAVKADREVLMKGSKKDTNYKKIKLSQSDVPSILLRSLDKAIAQYDWKNKIKFNNTDGYIEIKGLENLNDSEFKSFIQAYDQAGKIYGTEWSNGNANDHMAAFQKEYDENINNLNDNVINMTEALHDAYINSEETDLDRHFDNYQDYTDWLNTEANRLINLNDDIKITLDEAKDIVKSSYAEYANETDKFYAKVEDLYGENSDAIKAYLINLDKSQRKYLEQGTVTMTAGKDIDQYQEELAQASFDDYWNRGNRTAQNTADYLTKLASDDGIEEEDVENLKRSLQNVDAISTQYKNALEEWEALQLDSAGYSDQSTYLKKVRDIAIEASDTYQQAYFQTMGQGIIDQATAYDQVKDQKYNKDFNYIRNKDFYEYEKDFAEKSQKVIQDYQNSYEESTTTIQGPYGKQQTVDLKRYNIEDAESARQLIIERAQSEDNSNKTNEEIEKYWNEQPIEKVIQALIRESNEAAQTSNDLYVKYIQDIDKKIANQENKKETIGGQLIDSGMSVEQITTLFTPDAAADSEIITQNILTITNLLGQLQGEGGLQEYFELNPEATEASVDTINKMLPILTAIGKENEYDLNTLRGQQEAYKAIQREINNIDTSKLKIDIDTIDVEQATKELEKFSGAYASLIKQAKQQKLKIDLENMRTASADLKKFNDTWNTMTESFTMSSDDFAQATKDFPQILEAFDGFAEDGSIQLNSKKMKEFAKEYKDAAEAVKLSSQEIKDKIADLQEDANSLNNIAQAMEIIEDVNEDQKLSWEDLSAVEKAEITEMISAALDKVNTEISAANDTMSANVDIAESTEQMAQVVTAANATAASSYLQLAQCAAEAANAIHALQNGESYTVDTGAGAAPKVKAVSYEGSNGISSSTMKRSTGKAPVTGDKKELAIELLTEEERRVSQKENGTFIWTDKEGNEIPLANQFSQEEMATIYSSQDYVQAEWERRKNENRENQTDLITTQSDLLKEIERSGKWDDPSKSPSGGGGSDKDKDKEDPRDIRDKQELTNLQRERNKLEKEYNELQEGGIYTLPLRLKQIKKEIELLEKERKVQQRILKDKEDIVEEKKKDAAGWEKYLKQNDDGSFEYTEDYVIDSQNGKLSVEDEKLQELVEAGNELADQKQTLDDIDYKKDEYEDERDNSIGEAIDQGVDWVNQAIEGMGQVAQSVLQMIEKVAQSMVDGFKSFLGWLTIRIDDEHDIGELDESLKNRKELLDWEFDKYAEKNFDYTKGTNSKSQENLFENINDAAQNVLIRLQNQRRLYENSFRQLEDLGTNINSDIEASLEELYDVLYGVNGIFTKINDQVQYLENRFERATKWNLTNIREMDPIAKINEWLGTNFEDVLGDALSPLNIFDGTMVETFFKKSLEQIAGLEITEYRLGDVGESLLQKIANFFYELSPKFDADYQIVNKSELVDALNQKMQTIITNGTITSQFVQNYLDYLTEIESQMESEVENIRNAESEIINLYDEMTEILEKGKDEYTDLQQQLYDAIVSEKESIKEELEELNSNITDADSDLVNVLKNNLEQMRQMRDNDKTESDLQDKEARLAYLRQDTSGANKQEILRLEKELKEGQQSYTDKLIDQKISELEKQNEEAADQRQIQIDLLQEEINNTKQIWETVKSLMDGISGYGSWDDILKGEIKREAYQAIIDQLKKSADFEDKSAFDQDTQINDWGVLIRKASLYGTMLKDEYQEAYNDLKILRNVLDQDTKLPSDNAADSMWHNYVAFSNLETAVKDNTDAVKNAVSVINRIVDAKTLSFDETGSIFQKATESGATIQAMSGLEDAVKNFANDMASGLPSILTQVTTGAGNLAKGILKGMGATIDTATGAIALDIKAGDIGEAAGMVMEGVSNFFAAGCDAISLMCDIIGDTSPGFTDMGVAAGTLIANWLDNAFEEVDDHLRENVGYILDEMYGEEVEGSRLGGYYQQIGEEIAGQKEALLQYFDENGKDGTDFVKKLYSGIEERYKDINDQISRLDGNDIEGYNKQYSRFLALQKVLEKIGHTETIETYASNSISNLNKWAGEIGSLFAELSEKERQIVVDAINNAIYEVIKDEVLPSGHPKTDIWESNLKFQTSDIKYYNDIYKEFIDNVNYSVDAIDEAITAINSVFYDPYENEYTSPSAQLLVKKLEQLEGKRAEQEVQFEKSIWDTFIDNAKDAWGEFGNHILQAADAGREIINNIWQTIIDIFGGDSDFQKLIKKFLGTENYALGGAINRAQRALVGEFGPELVQHANGTATIVGRYGPEMADLQAGDQVYTAEQTKKILRGGGAINFNRFAEGTVGNFIGRAPFLPGLASIDITTPTRALASGQTTRENNFNLNLNLEGLTVDSVDRVDEVANRVWDKLNTTISSAIWPYNRL